MYLQVSIQSTVVCLYKCSWWVILSCTVPKWCDFLSLWTTSNHYGKQYTGTHNSRINWRQWEHARLSQHGNSWPPSRGWPTSSRQLCENTCGPRTRLQPYVIVADEVTAGSLLTALYNCCTVQFVSSPTVT